MDVGCWMLLDVHSHAVDATPINALKAGHVDVGQAVALVLGRSGGGRGGRCRRVRLLLLLLLLLGHGGRYGRVVALPGVDGGPAGAAGGRARQRVRTVAVTGQCRVTGDEFAVAGGRCRGRLGLRCYRCLHLCLNF